MGQTYGGDKPYSIHLEHVADVLIKEGYDGDTDILIVACLHDAIEDYKGSKYKAYRMVYDKFGQDVADSVYNITDELGRTRHESKSKTYAKTVQDRKASIIKVADRIANIKYSIETNNIKKIEMYCDEHDGFYAVRNEHNYKLFTILERHITSCLQILINKDR